MDRPYCNGDGSDEVDFFVGFEVEKSPAYNKKTLFVDTSTCPSFSTIHYNIEISECDHVYIGANMSFDINSIAYYDTIIGNILDTHKTLVTIDIPVEHLQNHDVANLLIKYKSDYRFVPMISVKIPNIIDMNYNTTIKIDDVGFNKSNPGVWCHSLQSLKSTETYTPWNKYEKDSKL